MVSMKILYLQGIEEMGFSMMTEIQAQTIPHLLEGRDLVGAAKTGKFNTTKIKIQDKSDLSVGPGRSPDGGFSFSRWK